MRFRDIVDRFNQEAFDRYIHLTNLLLSLSFGGLIFMLTFEQTFLTAHSQGRWLIHLAWFLMAGSALLGLCLQHKLCMNPLLRRAKAESQVAAMPASQRESKPTIGEIPTGLDNFLFWSQSASFYLAILTLIAFKALNL